LLQTAIYRAKKDKKDVKEVVRLEHGTKTRTINIQVKTIKLPNHEEVFFLVLFSETSNEKIPDFVPESCHTPAGIAIVKNQNQNGKILAKRIVTKVSSSGER
jgi:hypothetical protein